MMQNELVELGQVFQGQREGKSLSLKEIENATSIRMSYLQAIEEGQLGKLISPVYAQGFIKKYAAYLGLDGETLIQRYPSVLRVLSEHTNATEEFGLGIGSIEVRGSPGSDVKWLPNLMWVLGSVVTILTGWFLARYFGLF